MNMTTRKKLWLIVAVVMLATALVSCAGTQAPTTTAEAGTGAPTQTDSQMTKEELSHLSDHDLLLLHKSQFQSWAEGKAEVVLVELLKQSTEDIAVLREAMVKGTIFASDEAPSVAYAPYVKEMLFQRTIPSVMEFSSASRGLKMFYEQLGKDFRAETPYSYGESGNSKTIASLADYYDFIRTEMGKSYTENGFVIQNDGKGGAIAKVFFGSYEQDGNLENGPEPIEWHVIRLTEDQAVLSPVKTLDVVSYQTVDDMTAYHWASSHLRTWLNEDFFHSAFTEAERALILPTTVKNSETLRDSTPVGVQSTGEAPLTVYGTGGADTVDRVFLYSPIDAYAFLPEIGLEFYRYIVNLEGKTVGVDFGLKGSNAPDRLTDYVKQKYPGVDKDWMRCCFEYYINKPGSTEPEKFRSLATMDYRSTTSLEWDGGIGGLCITVSVDRIDEAIRQAYRF